MKKKYFFGWENIKWAVREIVNMYSSQASFFSKKRIESGIAFAIGQFGMIFFLLKRYQSLSMSDFLIWAGIEFAVAGYMINQIQKEKMTKSEPTVSEN
jgi:hypothetical protein